MYQSLRQQLSSISLQTFLLGLYAFCVILCPPIAIHGKTIYPSELCMLLVVGYACLVALRGQLLNPPKALILTWIGIVVAYVSGIFRSNIAYDIIIYKSLTSPAEQSFHAIQDAVRCLHWLLLISTPWLISQLKDKFSGTGTVQNFLKWFQVMIGLSALAAILDHFNWINLTKIYPYPHYSNWWTGRTYGTLPSPLEASLVYAFGALASIISLKSQFKGISLGNLTNEIKKSSSLQLFQIVVCGLAIIFTQGQVAEACLVVSVAAVFFQEISPSKKNKLLLFLAIAGVVSGLIAFGLGFHLKLESVAKRTMTWAWWIQQVIKFPRILLTGIGFSAVYVDNSSLWVLITGGLVLFSSLLYWLHNLLQGVSKENYPLLLFWVLTWLGLDSIGYWGVGRIMWMLMSLAWWAQVGLDDKSRSVESWACS